MTEKDSRRHEAKLEGLANEKAIEKAMEATIGDLCMGRHLIFCLPAERSPDPSMTFSEKIQIGAREVTKEWALRKSGDAHWPEKHEVDVWNSIQRILGLRARAGQLTNPLQTTLDEIRGQMPDKGKDGEEEKAIVRSLSCLFKVGLEVNYSCGNRGIGNHFSLIATLVVGQRTAPDGKISGQVRISFGHQMFDGIQKHHALPLETVPATTKPSSRTKRQARNKNSAPD